MHLFNSAFVWKRVYVFSQIVAGALTANIGNAKIIGGKSWKILALVILILG